MASITVQGMKCQHCAGSTKKALEALGGITDVEVNLATGEVSFKGTADPQDIKDAVAKVGFTVEE